MGVSGEYQKYQQTGGTLTEIQYGYHLNNVREYFFHLIVTDPEDHHTDIGRLIFECFENDLQSAMNFSRVSKGFYERSRVCWFTGKCKEIVLKHIQQGISWTQYLKEGGWTDFLIIAVKIAGVAVTIKSGIKASNHASRIPPDAPKKTETMCIEGIPTEVTYIDHPEARNAEFWEVTSFVTGASTASAFVFHGIHAWGHCHDLDLLFSCSEQELLSDTTTSFPMRLLFTDFHHWKHEKLKEHLSINPKNWQQHPQLSQKICPLSKDFMLFPVKDKCGHTLDYRSVRAYQLNPQTQDPHECPVSTTKPNRGFLEIKFDMAQFREIQRIIHS